MSTRTDAADVQNHENTKGTKKNKSQGEGRRNETRIPVPGTGTKSRISLSKFLLPRCLQLYRYSCTSTCVRGCACTLMTHHNERATPPQHRTRSDKPNPRPTPRPPCLHGDSPHGYGSSKDCLSALALHPKGEKCRGSACNHGTTDTPVRSLSSLLSHSVALASATAAKPAFARPTRTALRLDDPKTIPALHPSIVRRHGASLARAHESDMSCTDRGGTSIMRHSTSCGAAPRASHLAEALIELKRLRSSAVASTPFGKCSSPRFLACAASMRFLSSSIICCRISSTRTARG